jgi:hypothetical protein
MTDWKPTMLTASAPSGEMMTWINPSAIDQLKREVDALKAQAAPEGEVTEAEQDAFLRKWFFGGWPNDFDCDAKNYLRKNFNNAYRAMRAARPAPTPQPSEELRLLRELRGALLEIGTADWWQRRCGLNMAAYSSATKEIARLLAALDAAEAG